MKKKTDGGSVGQGLGSLDKTGVRKAIELSSLWGNTDLHWVNFLAPQ